VAKKKNKRDDPNWEPPEFDEVQFMRTEMRSARAAIVVVLWAVPAALVSWGLTLLGIAVVAFFAGLGMMFLLKWIIPLVRVDTSKYKRKDWLGHGGTFFFSWLAFWILLLNPPFADLTSPAIYAVTVDGRAVGCGAILAGVSVDPHSLNVSAGDNVGIAIVTVEFTTGSPLGMDHVGGTLWTYLWDVPSSPASATIVAKDVNGHLSAPCKVIVTA